MHSIFIVELDPIYLNIWLVKFPFFSNAHRKGIPGNFRLRCKQNELLYTRLDDVISKPSPPGELPLKSIVFGKSILDLLQSE